MWKKIRPAAPQPSLRPVVPAYPACYRVPAMSRTRHDRRAFARSLFSFGHRENQPPHRRVCALLRPVVSPSTALPSPAMALGACTIPPIQITTEAGMILCFQPLLTADYRPPRRPILTSFRINTYASVETKGLYLPLKSTHTKKGGGGPPKKRCKCSAVPSGRHLR